MRKLEQERFRDFPVVTFQQVNKLIWSPSGEPAALRLGVGVRHGTWTSHVT